MSSTSRAKKASARAKPAPRKRVTAKKPSPVPQVTLAEMIAADIHRASLRMSVLFYGLAGIMTSGLMSGACVWFVLVSYERIDTRTTAHGVVMAKIATDNRIRIQELERRAIIESTSSHDRWTRSHMVKWCIEANRTIKGFNCPSPLKVAPSDRELALKATEAPAS